MFRLISDSVIKPTSVNCVFSRSAQRLRGKAPGVAKTIKQRLQALKLENYDAEVERCINIGFPIIQSTSGRKQTIDRIRFLKEKKCDALLEKAARNQTLKAPIDEIREEWLKSVEGIKSLKTIGDHYGIYKTLFKYAYFYPKFTMQIEYCNEDNDNLSSEWCTPIRFGNFIKPTDAQNKPTVRFEDNQHLWTLLMLNLDGDVSGEQKEHVHWFIGNIPGNDVAKGETIVEYLQPVPPKGTGYHRHVFLLLQQNSQMDYSTILEQMSAKNGVGLDCRKFSTLEFYRERQDQLTPASYSFFQCNWDESVQNIYHKVFGEDEPIYEYDFPKSYVNPKQKWFPIKQAFNLYLDKYRDEKQINKEFLERKLKKVHPFEEPEPEFQFPNAERLPHSMPSWIKTETKKERLKIGRVRKLLDEPNC